jgi:hypothetical protein
MNSDSRSLTIIRLIFHLNQCKSKKKALSMQDFSTGGDPRYVKQSLVSLLIKVALLP